jgi:hypothetical protein
MADATVGSAASDYGTKVTPPNPLYLGPSVGGERFVALGPSALQSAILSSFLQMPRKSRVTPDRKLENIIERATYRVYSTWIHVGPYGKNVKLCLQSTVKSAKQPNRHPRSRPRRGGASKPWLNETFPPTHFDPAPTGCRLHVNMCMQTN